MWILSHQINATFRALQIYLIPMFIPETTPPGDVISSNNEQLSLQFLQVFHGNVVDHSGLLGVPDRYQTGPGLGAQVKLVEIVVIFDFRELHELYLTEPVRWVRFPRLRTLLVPHIANAYYSSTTVK